MTFKLLNKLVRIFAIIAIIAVIFGTSNQVPIASASVSPAETPISQSVMFIENVGQFDEGARFQVRGGNSTLWLAEDGIWITLHEKPESTASKDFLAINDPLSIENDMEYIPVNGVNIKLSFDGANPHPVIEPFNQLETSVNYFIGNDPDQWHSNVPAWGGVRYKDLYPGINLEICTENDQTVQKFVVHDGADLTAVKLNVEGTNVVALIGENLSLQTEIGDYLLPLFQTIGISSESLSYPRIIGNQVISPFASSMTLIEKSNSSTSASDLLYSTFLGGSANEHGSAIAIDTSGAAYVTGYTYSSDLPITPGSYDVSQNGSHDTFIVKLNAVGTALSYATFLGGNSTEEGEDIVIDASGAAYVSGTTFSSNFPTSPGAYDVSYNGNGGDAFAVKLNPSGSALSYATFLGGNYYDHGRGIAIDTSGAAYVTGWTGSSDFPTSPGAYGVSLNGSYDAFVMKLNAVGTALSYATFLGGSANEHGCSISIDASGAAYVTGVTYSSDFPITPGAYDVSLNGSYDAFVVKLNAVATALSYATFLGGNKTDEGEDIAIDASGSTYVTGYTYSSDFPTSPGAYDTSFKGDDDAFVVKLNPSGSALSYATFLGGYSTESGRSIAIDASGAAYVTGTTSSPDFPTSPGAYDDFYWGIDAFVVKLDPSGSALSYGTFLGGNSTEEGEDIAIDASGAAYVTGTTFSYDFPTTIGVFDTTYNGDNDIFVTKLAMGEMTPTFSVSGGIRDGTGNPIPDVTMKLTLPDNTPVKNILNSTDGNYTFLDIPAGTYLLYPQKANYTFSPYPLTVVLNQDKSGQNFVGTRFTCGISSSSPNAKAANACELGIPFLDLPFNYTNFTIEADSTEINRDGKTGRLTAWVDHDRRSTYVQTWREPTATSSSVAKIGWSDCILRKNCYDQHEGIDFNLYYEPVYPAAPGVVEEVCYTSSTSCTFGKAYGNYILINHENEYATLYGHLSDIYVNVGDRFLPYACYTIAKSGNTGGKLTGAHLHFSVLYDLNSDLKWSFGEEVDPYGWSPPNTADPMGRPNIYIWKPKFSVTNSLSPSTLPQSVAFENLNAAFPPASLTTDTTVSLGFSSLPGVLDILYQNVIQPFYLSIYTWVSGGLSTISRMATEDLPAPVTISVNYDENDLGHLDISQLSLRRWNETTETWETLDTTIDGTTKTASANTDQTGQFTLTAPLLCSGDLNEPNDEFGSSPDIPPDNTTITNLFDISTDEDWFRLNADEGMVYHIQTSNLSSGVDTLLEIYDPDGTTLLASDDNSNGGNASLLQWQAPTTASYFVRVSRIAGSEYGCSSSYELKAYSPSISGNTGTGYVTLTYHDYVDKSTTSAEDGTYSFHVSNGWTGTVIPLKDGYVFEPVSKNYTNVTLDQVIQNYIAHVLPGKYSKTSPFNAATNRPRNLNLSWKTSAGALSYEYCIDKTDDNKCGTGWKSTGTNTSISLNGLTSAKYYWQVRARNQYGVTYANNNTWWSFVVPKKPLAFNKTSPLNNAIDKPINVYLKWAKSTYAVKYEYCIDTLNNGKCDTSWISVGSKLTNYLTNLKRGTRYYWQVRAKNAVGTVIANSGIWWNFKTR